MSDDWAKKFVEDHNRKQSEKRQLEKEKRKRRELTEAGGREKFRQIREQIQRDVDVLRGGALFQSLNLQQQSESVFGVFLGEVRTLLWCELVENVLMKCEYREPEERSVTLRLCADLDGVVSVYKNGNTVPFVDESEVSEFLLRPLLDHIGE